MLDPGQRDSALLLDLSRICLLELVIITKSADLAIGTEVMYLDVVEVMGLMKLTVRPCKDDDKVGCHKAPIRCTCSASQVS